MSSDERLLMLSSSDLLDLFVLSSKISKVFNWVKLRVSTKLFSLSRGTAETGVCVWAWACLMLLFYSVRLEPDRSLSIHTVCKAIE